jgi:hypothetical protein
MAVMVSVLEDGTWVCLVQPVRVGAVAVSATGMLAKPETSTSKSPLVVVEYVALARVAEFSA